MKAIEHSMRRFTHIVDIKLAGQCTDIGIGGTLESLATKLKKYDICQNYYLIGSCSLHNNQTCLCNAIISVFGEREEGKKIISTK